MTGVFLFLGNLLQIPVLCMLAVETVPATVPAICRFSFLKLYTWNPSSSQDFMAYSAISTARPGSKAPQVNHIGVLLALGTARHDITTICI